jgi:hypothetical protein
MPCRASSRGVDGNYKETEHTCRSESLPEEVKSNETVGFGNL